MPRAPFTIVPMELPLFRIAQLIWSFEKAAFAVTGPEKHAHPFIPHALIAVLMSSE